MPSIMSLPGIKTQLFIDYDWEGNVLEFVVDYQVFVDADNGIYAPGWREYLALIVKDAGWDKDDGDGLRAFVIKLKKDGFL